MWSVEKSKGILILYKILRTAYFKNNLSCIICISVSCLNYFAKVDKISEFLLFSNHLNVMFQLEGPYGWKKNSQWHIFLQVGQFKLTCRVYNSRKIFKQKKRRKTSVEKSGVEKWKVEWEEKEEKAAGWEESIVEKVL